MKKKLIKRKAEDLFKQYGVKAVTMDEISNQLSISKKTLYSFFSDKNDLVGEVIFDLLDRNKTACLECHAEATNAIEEIFFAARTLETVLDGVNPLMLFDLERGFPGAFQKFQEYKYDFLKNLITKNIEWGKKDGIYREDINADLYARARLEMMTQAFNDQLFPRTENSFLQIQRQLLELFLYAMVTPAGLKIINQHKKQSNPKTG